MGKKALVVSGGGSKGAFAVGVLDYLVNRKKMEFDIFSGSSTGALISSLMVTGEVNILKEIYSSVKTKDIIKLKFPLFWLFSNSIYSTKPLQKLIEKYINDERTRNILNSKKQMFLTTVSLQSSETIYFQTGPSGRSSKSIIEPVKNKKILQQALLASSNQPGLMPPVEILTSNGKEDQYCDGGMREIAPINIAIDNDAEEIYAIVLSPKDDHVLTNKIKNIPDVLIRTLNTLTDEMLDNDIHLSEIYNSGVLLLENLKEELVDKGIIGPDKYNQIINKNKNLFLTKKVKKINIIRPDSPLEGGSNGLEFIPEVMKEFMDRGYRKAQELFG